MIRHLSRYWFAMLAQLAGIIALINAIITTQKGR